LVSADPDPLDLGAPHHEVAVPEGKGKSAPLSPDSQRRSHREPKLEQASAERGGGRLVEAIDDVSAS